MSQKYAHVFGPVPSRRLGRSLGVDLVPYKICSYDCLYCQLGRTTELTIERQEYVPVAEVFKEILAKFDSGEQADFITLSGSGEPTLNSRFGEMIQRIKKVTDTPVAVLTNASLLWDPQVREDLSAADLVVPSLDAGDADMFQRVNRPQADLDFDKMLEGLTQFAKEFPGRLWLEVFFLKGLTAMPEEAAKMADLVRGIRANRVQLNTVARPPAEATAEPVPEAEIKKICALFGDNAEIIADYTGTRDQAKTSGRQEDIIRLLERRPCTLDDISVALGVHPVEILKQLDELTKAGVVKQKMIGNKLFYVSLKH